MQRWYSWSLQRRVLVTSGVVVTVMIVIGVAAFAVTLDRILYSASLDSARTQASQVAQLVSSGRAPAEEALTQVRVRGALLQVLDRDGRVVAASERRLEARSISSLRPVVDQVDVAQVTSIPGELGEPYAIVAQGVADPSGTAYIVVVGSPLNIETDTVQTATLLLAVGAATLLVLLLFLIRRVLQQALAPVERIRSQVSQISQVRGRGTIDVPPTGDEIARLAETMNDMLTRLERADASTRRFVSDASHELRSPLATIRAAVEVSGAAGAAPDERDAVIHAEALRMQGLVDDLLTLAKADDGAPMLKEDVDLDDIVDGEARRVRATGVDVEAHIAAARVLGDPVRLEQMVRNLVDNAVRHTSGAVALSVGTEGAEVVVRVDNDGPPIPVADRDSVFERFARLQESRQRDTGGSGLGLAIVRTVAVAHGGTAVATQTPGGSCRFEVRLPAGRGSAAG
jgi:signal transduction histidine kinase